MSRRNCANENSSPRTFWSLLGPLRDRISSVPEEKDFTSKTFIKGQKLKYPNAANAVGSFRRRTSFNLKTTLKTMSSVSWEFVANLFWCSQAELGYDPKLGNGSQYRSELNFRCIVKVWRPAPRVLHLSEFLVSFRLEIPARTLKCSAPTNCLCTISHQKQLFPSANKSR